MKRTRLSSILPVFSPFSLESSRTSKIWKYGLKRACVGVRARVMRKMQSSDGKKREKK